MLLSDLGALNLSDRIFPLFRSDPHPMFAIIFVGKEETPYGMQLDFLAAKSTYCRQYFKANESILVENIIKLPDTDPVVFSLAQHYMYTGQVFPDIASLPSYEILINLWRLGHDLDIEGLCDAALEAMVEYRRRTSHIPATPLLVQAWMDTPEGSTIRKLLLSWAAEYMRSSDARAEFARSLPQEVLSELVVAMSSLESAPIVPDTTSSVPPVPAISETTSAGLTTGQRRNASHLDTVEADASARPTKKQRHSDVLLNDAPSTAVNTKAGSRKGNSRASLPSATNTKAVGKRKSNAGLVATADEQPFSANQRLNFCADLLTRMLSGPGKNTSISFQCAPSPSSPFLSSCLSAADVIFLVRLVTNLCPNNSRVLDPSGWPFQRARQSRYGWCARLS